MKERNEKPISQKEVDDATLNFVSRQAQDAILDPNLPEAYKDQVLDVAIGTISKIAEKRAIYESRGRRKKYGKRIRTI